MKQHDLCCDNISAAVRQGIDAYAIKQAALVIRMGKLFAEQWYPVLVKNGKLIDWPAEFMPTFSDTIMDS
jgi:hypothetical protein